MNFMKHISEMIGKVILDAKEANDMILLEFAEDEYFLIEAEPGYGGDCASIEILEYDDMELDQKVDFGFITKEDARKTKEEAYKKWKYDQKKEEMKLLRKLKEKYE